MNRPTRRLGIARLVVLLRDCCRGVDLARGVVDRGVAEVHAPTRIFDLVTLGRDAGRQPRRPHATPLALIGMVGAAAVVAMLDLGERAISVIGTIPSGLPVPALPHVSPDGVLSLVPAALASRSSATPTTS